MRTTPAVPAADMSDNTLLLDLLAADDVFGEDASPAAQRQAAVFAAAAARWMHRGDRALGALGGPPARVGRRWILMAQDNPANLFAIMRGEPCRRQ